MIGIWTLVFDANELFAWPISAPLDTAIVSALAKISSLALVTELSEHFVSFEQWSCFKLMASTDQGLLFFSASKTQLC